MNLNKVLEAKITKKDIDTVAEELLKGKRIWEDVDRKTKSGPLLFYKFYKKTLNDEDFNYFII